MAPFSTSPQLGIVNRNGIDVYGLAAVVRCPQRGAHEQLKPEALAKEMWPEAQTKELAMYLRPESWAWIEHESGPCASHRLCVLTGQFCPVLTIKGW